MVNEVVRELERLGRRVELLERQERALTYFPLFDYVTITSDTSLSADDTTGTSVDISSAVPAKAKAALVRLQVWGDTLGQRVFFGPNSDADAARHHGGQFTIDGSGSRNENMSIINIEVAQTIYRTASVLGGTVHYRLYVLGYFV
jgi:hypothetical protein